MGGAWLLAVLALIAAEPAVTIKVARPDEQLSRLLALFEGTRAPHPAAALAAWRRAGGDRLGKASEAAITALNPEMVPELRSLDGTSVHLDFGPDGGLHWSASIPRDDGTLAALATAIALSGGGRVEPLGTIRVDRLGGPGSALMARVDPTVVLAGSRDDLRMALEGLRAAGRQPIDREDSGWSVRVVPEALARASGRNLRRLAEGLEGLGARDVEARASLQGERLGVDLRTRLARPLETAATIEPAWLDLVPASGTRAALALAIDPKPEAIAEAFAVADAIEKADPANARLAPLRVRLNVLASGFGVRPEADVWPRIRGLTGVVTPDGGLVALHATDLAAADRLWRVVLPGLSRVEVPAGLGDLDTLTLGRFAGRALISARRGPTVLLGWGESAIPAALDALDHPGRSAGSMIREGWGDRPPQRAGAVWPDRLVEGDLARALEGANPIRWRGWSEQAEARDRIDWDGLRGTTRRLLGRLIPRDRARPVQNASP